MYGKLLSNKQVGQRVLLTFENETITVEVINENVFNVLVGTKEQARVSKAIEALNIEECQISITNLANGVIIASPKLKAYVYDNFKIDFHDGITDKLICADYRGTRKPFVRRGNGHIAAEEGHEIQVAAKRHRIEVVKAMSGDESFYGLGDKTGHLNKRGYAYEMWNTDDPTPHVESFKSLYKSIPFFLTLKENVTYGIFFDNTFKTYFDMGKENANYFYFGADEGDLNYYFIYGDKPADVLKDYTKLTGRTPLPQKWTLGYQQSRFTYATRERLEEIITSFRELDIPCDAVHLDIHHLDDYKVFTFHKENYQNPTEIFEFAKSHGIKLIPIVDPGIKKEKGYAPYDEGIKNGYFATDCDGLPYVNRVWPGDALYPDYSNPTVRQWWGDLHKGLTDLGVEGIWTDMNEPSSFNGPLPDDVQFNNEGLGANHLEMHNVYGHLMAKATFEGMKKLTNKRPYVITRAAFSGTQKYSTVWTGDNQSFWEHLRLAIPQQLNLGVSGFSIIGTDIGGFSYDTTKELFCRWIQLGIFSPLCRNHSSDHTRDQEPWAFDQETLDINRTFIKLRYKLIPYLYDLLWLGEESGLPVLRPLVLHYPADKHVKEMNDQFLVGEQLLVAPVVHQGATYRTVYLPEGIWYEYDTDQVHEGGSFHVKSVDLSTCPMYVKGGSIIPNDEVKKYVNEYKSKTLTLDVYPGEGSYDHIEDDGESFDYQNGTFNHYCFTQSNQELIIERKQMNYIEKYEAFNIKYHKQVNKVMVDDVEVDFESVPGGISVSVSNTSTCIKFI